MTESPQFKSKPSGLKGKMLRRAVKGERITTEAARYMEGELSTQVGYQDLFTRWINVINNFFYCIIRALSKASTGSFLKEKIENMHGTMVFKANFPDLERKISFIQIAAGIKGNSSPRRYPLIATWSRRPWRCILERAALVYQLIPSWCSTKIDGLCNLPIRSTTRRE